MVIRSEFVFQGCRLNLARNSMNSASRSGGIGPPKFRKTLKAAAPVWSKNWKLRVAMPSMWPGFSTANAAANCSPADVHVEGIGLDVEELARRAEAAELPVNFNRRCAIGHQHPHRTKSLKALKQLLPPGNIEFDDPICWKGPDDFDLRHAEITGQLQGHFSGILLDGSPNAIRDFSLLGRLVRLHGPCLSPASS